MPEHPITPVAITRYDTVSQRAELFDGPDAVPYRFNWRAVHGAQLAADFKIALKKLEGLMYVIWGSQPDYAGNKQWHTRENPRCRWDLDQWWQQPSDNFFEPPFWNFLETVSLGQLYSGVMPTVPVRSRSGDPRAQFKRAQHSDYFPYGSVERDAGHQVFDPASTFKKFAAWPDAEDVVVRYTVPDGRTATAATLVTSLGSIPMTETSPSVWEGTIEAQTQGTWVDWYIAAQFADDPGKTHYDPYVGETGGEEVAPTLAGPVADPEHGRAPNAAYSFVFYSHYNPYAGGLPELLDEDEPHTAGNWLRRGTDGYRFDSSENIQPGLINLARYVLDRIGELVEHNPNQRGSSDRSMCCESMPIRWRWSGANRPDLYRTGGKGGAAGSSPLHNNPTHLNAGSADARKSWRGIEMAWRGASDVPGFFPDNWEYGDNESWLAWPGRLPIHDEQLDALGNLIYPLRSYGGRGLRAGDAIDPVHLLEVIDAVDYLINAGLWRQVPIYTAPKTILERWGKECGWQYELHERPNDPDDEIEFVHGGKCCQNPGGGQWEECIPYERPTIEECPSWGQSKCGIGRFVTEYINPPWSDPTRSLYEGVACNAAHNAFGGEIFNVYEECSNPQSYPAVHSRNYFQSGAAFYLCGPDQSLYGPAGDNLHGNGLFKNRTQPAGNFKDTGPSMGNRFADGSVHVCQPTTPGSPTPDFNTVVDVVDEGIAGGWFKFDYPGGGELLHPPPPIPGIGLAYPEPHWQPWGEETTSLYFYDASGPPSQCSEGLRQLLWAYVEWFACDIVYARMDLNLDAEGVPRLYDYNLNIDDPFDDCPCRTWTGPGFCE
jgi:hypothetical protein